MSDMSNNKISEVTEPTVIAIARQGDTLRGVELTKQADVLEVRWTKSSDAGEVSWRSFAVECGLSTELEGKIQANGNKVFVAGFSSAAVAFYRIAVPAVKQKELEAMVRLQAEARIPLPAEQTELAWRAGKERDGQVDVTMAAARREHLQGFIESVQDFRPAKILLDCEAIVRVWRELFFEEDKSEKIAVVVSIGLRSTQVCLAEGTRLAGAVTLDTGMDDLSSGYGETAERFAQDMRSVLELFALPELTKVPVFVLSDGSNVVRAMADCLILAGLNAKISDFRFPACSSDGMKRETLNVLYEYRVPIGLALMALDSDAEQLNIFERLYSPAKDKAGKRWIYSLKATCTIAAVMLALLVIVFYVLDITKLNAIERHLKQPNAETNCKLLMQRQKLVKTVALQRPDLLELLSRINSGGAEGIMLSSLDFKKGRSVTIGGQASGSEQIYEFEKKLQTRKGIKDVKIQSATKASRGNKVNFTITFHYKNFTKGRVR